MISEEQLSVTQLLAPPAGYQQPDMDTATSTMKEDQAQTGANRNKKMLARMEAEAAEEVEERESTEEEDWTPLMKAAGNNVINTVKLLLANKADVNVQSHLGETALHICSREGHDRIVNLLVDAGANLEDKNMPGYTPLMEAARAGYISVAMRLLKAGAGINTYHNAVKATPLTVACFEGDFDMVAFLLDAGANLHHITDDKQTALMEASVDGHTEVAKMLLERGAQVNSMSADSFYTPLTLAARGGYVELATLLLSYSANLEEVNHEGYTPLMVAAREGHMEVVTLLLDKGANINALSDETKETALTLACCAGYLEVADYLLKKGANIELGCSTPLMEATQEGHVDVVKHLLDNNANVHAETNMQDTALIFAAEYGHSAIVALLIEHQANVDHCSDGGCTPLMKAAQAGHTCTLDYLIKAGALVNKLTTCCYHTALSLAAAGGHVACVERLLIHGADPCVKLKDGMTILMEASRGGFTHIVEILTNWPSNCELLQVKLALELDSYGTSTSQVDTDLATQQAESIKFQSLKNVLLRFTQRRQQAEMSLAREAAAMAAEAIGRTAYFKLASIAAKPSGHRVNHAYQSTQALTPMMAAAVAHLLPTQQQQFQQAVEDGADPAVVQSMFMMGGAAPGMGTGKRPPLPLHIALQNHLQAHRVTEGNVNDLANALKHWDNKVSNV